MGPWHISPIGKFVLLLVFVACAVFGALKHGFERGGGLIGGGEVRYSYHYGRAYSWEPGYDLLRGIAKDQYPEYRCGSLYVDIYDWRSRQPSKSDKYIYSEHCDMLMSLKEFVYRYSNGITVKELMVEYEELSEDTQVALFQEWKSQGKLDDIRYKDVTEYDWGNILDFIRWVIAIPLAITFGWWLLITRIDQFIKKASRK